MAGLRTSPVHNIRPLKDDPVELDIDAIEIDPTNPGSLTDSLRYKRREPSIDDSWDILGGIVYPIVVAQKPDDPARYIHVDGFGRYKQAQGRGARRIRAIVYPPLTLEQRICLRQTLNAAQEPFDVASIIKDLQALALERSLDLRDSTQIKLLVRDLPDKVQKREQDLVVLARWHPDAVKRIGESYGRRGPESAMGMDKVKELTKIMDIIATKHPEVAIELGGDMAVSERLFALYNADAFSRHGRSQEGIRAAADALRDLQSNDRRVREFLAGTLDLTAAGNPRPIGNLVKLCQEVNNLLLTKDPSSLTETECRALRGIQRSIEDLLA
ncbi:MAG: hypothetical protein C0506_00445 [Anaerolinea sp.]|nr:hypothetical protein [Anaerolinea sp.]